MRKIVFNHLSFNFTEQGELLKDVNAEFVTGKIHLMTGASGSGKSTLLKLIAGLLPKYGGNITAGSCDVPVGTRIGMLFQDPLMQFALNTPQHELEFTLENCQVPRAQMADRITTAFNFAQVGNLADRLITTLSGGQQQRVALAAVVAMAPDVLLLDEPFTSVDEQNRRFILQQLVKLNQQHGTTIIITDHECYGYRELRPVVWQLAAGHLQQLSPTQGQQLLCAADKQEKRSLNVILPANDAQEIVQLKQLSISRGATTLLAPTTIPVLKNKTTLITGANGVGKSTLLKAIAKLTDYDGTIMYENNDIQKISPGKYFQKVGLVFQHANDQFLNVTVGEELRLSNQNSHNPYFTSKYFHQALRDLDLAGREDQVVYSLSGGQKKKLQILLMLMMGQPLLLLDEPFTGLDATSLQVILKLIRACQEKASLTLVIVSHQLAGLRDFIDYHFVMQHQQLSYQRS